MEKNKAIMEVIERRRAIAELVEKGNVLLDKARSEKRQLADADEAQLQSIQADKDKAERELDIFISLNNIKPEELRSQPPTKPEPGAVNRTKEEQSAEKRAAFLKYIRGGQGNLNQAEERAIVEDTTGLYLVPQDMDSQIIASVGQINSFRRFAGIRTTTRDKVVFPKMADVTAGWGKLETGATPTEDTPTPSQKTIYVEDMNVLIKLGRDELMDTDANLEAAINERASIAFANLEAKAFAVGTGHSYSQPEGIAVDTEILASYKGDWSTADTAHPKDILTCEYALPAQYLPGTPGAAWLMHRKTEGAIRKFQEAVASGYYGNFMWAPGLLGAPNSMDTYPIFNQNDMHYPADAVDGINVIFGNFKIGYRIVDRLGISVLRLVELYAESGLVGFLFTKRTGGAPVLAEAFYGIYNET